MTRRELVRELQELIEALDRRLPRVGDAGEASIAHDAAALRDKAMKRLAELEEQGGLRAKGVPSRTDSNRF